MCPSYTIGDFAKLETKTIIPHVRLVMPVHDFVLDWRRCNLVANYVAEYVSYYFDQKDRAENLISSVFYELIEYLVSKARHETAVDIVFSSFEGWLVFEISVSMPPEEVSRLKELLDEIHGRDLDSFYVEFLEADLEEPQSKKMMGIVMIAHDYRAQLAALLHEGGEPSTVRAFVRQEEITT